MKLERLADVRALDLVQSFWTLFRGTSDVGSADRERRHLNNMSRKKLEPVSAKVRAVIRKETRRYSYLALQDLCRVVERYRPTLLIQAGVDQSLYDTDGTVIYNESIVSCFTEEDRFLIEDYVLGKMMLYFLPQSIASMPSETMKEVAEDTLLRRISCKDYAAEHHVSVRAVQKEKRRVLDYMVRFCFQNGTVKRAILKVANRK